MATSLQPKRLCNPAILKKIDFPLLTKLLEPFRAYLEGRSLLWTEIEAEFDYPTLAIALADPTEETPEELMDAIYFIDVMADDDLFDRIHAEAVESGVDLGTSNELTPADLAVRVWLADRNILERVHAEQYLTRPKKFQSYFADHLDVPDLQYPSDPTLKGLETDLNEWFDTHKKGRGTRVFPFFREDGVWFMVRHGQRMKREGTMEPNGGSGSKYYRPETFDVLIYYPEQRELTIHTQTKGETQAYCKHIGKHLFGDAGLFDFENAKPKYTLKPLIDQGPEVLACRKGEGVQAVRMVELQFIHDFEQRYVECHRGDDVFAAMAAKNRGIPEDAQLVRVSFKVLFEGAIKWRTVTLCMPNIASFDRESDAQTIHAWLAKRGFLCMIEPEAADARPAEAVAVS